MTAIADSQADSQDKAAAPQDREAGPGPEVAGLDVPFTRAGSLADQVCEAIVDAVALGKLRPGQRLIETELAQSLGISRVPVREAVKTLIAQGILEHLPHRGVRIVAFGEDRIQRICEARAALEQLAARDAAAVYRAEPERLARLDELADEIEHTIEHGDWLAACKADLAFHREICRVSGNEVVSKLWEALALHVLIVFGREILDELGNGRMAAQHRELREVLAGGDLPAVASEVQHHIMRLRRGEGMAIPAA